MGLAGRWASQFATVTEAVTHACLYLLLVFPGLVSLFYLAHDSHQSEAEYLDAGAGAQPISILLLSMLCGLAFTTWLLQRRRIAPWARSGVFLSLALWVAVVISSARSSVPGEAWPATLCLAYGIVVYWLVLERLPGGRLQVQVPQLLAVSGGVTGWIGICLFALLRPDVLTGAFFQPNVMAGYLVMTLPVTLALWVIRPSAGWFLCAVGEGAALLLTMSRAGLLTGTVVVLLFVVACGWFRPSRTVCLGLAGWAVCCWLLFAGLGSYAAGDGTFHWVPRRAVERAQNTRHEDVASVIARRAFYESALAIWREHPLWGVGMNAFNRYYPQHQTDFRWYSKYSHSMYLDWLAETGILATLLFLAVLMWTVWRWRQTRVALMQVGLGLGLLGTLLHSAVDVDWKFGVIPLTFWIMAATLAGFATPPEGMTGDTRGEMGDSSLEGPGGLQLVAAVSMLVAFGLSFRLWASTHQQLMGTYYVEHNRPDEAREAFENAVTLDAARSDAYEGLVDLCLSRYDHQHTANDLQMAARYADKAVQEDPHRSVEWSRLGQVRFAQQRWDDAEAAERKALELDPVNFPDFYNRLASLLASRGRDKEAVALWRQAEQQFPWDLIKGIQSFRQDALRPQIVGTHLELASWCYAHHELDNAMSRYRRVLDIEPDNPDAIFGMGTCFYGQNKPSDALPFLLKTEQQTPQIAVVHLLLGSCYGMQRQWADAKRELQEAERLDPRLKSQIDAAMPKMGTHAIKK